MTLEELMYLLGDLVDEHFELEDGKVPDTITRYFNMCSNDINPVAKYLKVKRLDYLGGSGIKRFSLPQDYMALVNENPLRFNGEPVPQVVRWGNGGFYIANGAINLEEPPTKDGTFELFYYAKLPKFTGDPEEEPVIEPQFHDIYARFAAVRWLQGDGFTSGFDAYSEFVRDYANRKRELEVYMLENSHMPYTITPYVKQRYSKEEF